MIDGKAEKQKESNLPAQQDITYMGDFTQGEERMVGAWDVRKWRSFRKEQEC